MPKLLAFAKIYYKCEALEGVPLENGGDGGSANSHWEKLYLPNEFMNPTVENPGIISNFTLLFLEGTGYYKVDYKYA